MIAENLLRSGQLKACKEQLFNQVKENPNDSKLRIFLFQLFCINCEWDKALKQLDVLRSIDDSTLAMVNTYEQLIHCEQNRKLVLDGDKPPSVMEESTGWITYYIDAFKKSIDGEYDKAFELISKGADEAPKISGKIDDNEQFSWFCDGDIRFGPIIEIIINGGYYWLSTDKIMELAFEPVEDLRDMVWRPVNITLKNRGKLIAFMPVRYPINSLSTDEQLLSRTCEWIEPIENFFIGNGQKIFLTDNGEYPLLGISTIRFSTD